MGDGSIADDELESWIADVLDYAKYAPVAPPLVLSTSAVAPVLAADCCVSIGNKT